MFFNNQASDLLILYLVQDLKKFKLATIQYKYAKYQCDRKYVTKVLILHILLSNKILLCII